MNTFNINHCQKESIGGSQPAILLIWMWVFIFAIAFAWVESAVVIYLREIYYNGSFNFPIVIKLENGGIEPDPLMQIEFGREIATLIMLFSVGWVAGRNSLQRFCYFMGAFGIWDIFYYIWLKVLIDWPSSIFDWDLFFFVPVPWVGPVIAPVLISVAMISAGIIIVFYDETFCTVRWQWYDWLVEALCAFLMIMAFCLDWKNIIQLPGCSSCTGIPNPFAWWLYLPVYLFSVFYFIFRFCRIICNSSKKMSLSSSRN